MCECIFRIYKGSRKTQHDQFWLICFTIFKVNQFNQMWFYWFNCSILSYFMTLTGISWKSVITALVECFHSLQTCTVPYFYMSFVFLTGPFHVNKLTDVLWENAIPACNFYHLYCICISTSCFHIKEGTMLLFDNAICPKGQLGPVLMERKKGETEWEESKSRRFEEWESW